MIVLVISVDIPFVLVAAYALGLLLGLDVAVFMAAWMCAHLLRTLIVSAYIYRALQPYDRWRAQGQPSDPARLHALDERLQRTPSRATLIHACAWALSVTATLAWAWFMLPPAALGSDDLIPGVCLALSGLAGAAGLALPVLNLVLEPERARISRTLAAAKLVSTAPSSSLTRRLLFYISTFVVMSTALMLGPSWARHVIAERYAGITELGVELTRARDAVERGESPTPAQLHPADAKPPLTQLDYVHQHLPPLDAEIAFDRRSERVHLVHALPDGRWLALDAPLPARRSLFHGVLAVFLLIFLVWSTSAALLIARALTGPLRRLSRFMRRLMQVGDLSAIEHLPVTEHNELGELTRGCNELVLGLLELVEGAQAVADGQLGVNINERGELGQAFLAMIAQLDELVTQIRATALDVVSASAEIHATIQQQVASSIQTREAVLAVTSTVHTLAESAEHIARSADEVRDNAERSSGTAQGMGERISELAVHTSGVSDLLEQIREIADRSDLLALNGSLEATRAGEAGRGFALVAAEMRRLAERVTATVADVREHIELIERSGATTTAATDASMTLSTETASAARGITVLTQQQREQSGIVSAAIGSMADFVEASARTSTETLAASEGLRRRVEELERLVRQFETRGVSDAPADWPQRREP